MRVLESPAGQGEGTFRLPWTADAWTEIRSGMSLASRDLKAKNPASGLPDPQEIGGELFNALFCGQVGLLWARSIGVLPDRGLRLQLRFKLDGVPPGSSLLHSLPWELLHQPDTRDFLALSRLTPVVRYLEVPRPVNLFRRPSVLRILVVICAPAGLPPLDLARERQEIQKAWYERTHVEVDFLDRPRVAALREALLRRPYHILHFMGHGTLDPNTGEGFLFFESEDGSADPVSGEALLTLLKDVTSLRLVFLNACETARASGERGLDPFAGMATALVLGGLPAVVAMQLPISDASAIIFSRAVHLRLAAGDPLDVAVTEGRQALFVADRSTLEWAIPVLFTRVPDGRIFDRKELRARDDPNSETRKRGLLAGVSVGLALLLAAILLRDLPDLRTARPTLAKVRVGAFQVGRHEVTQKEFLQFVLANPRWRRDRIEPGLHDRDYLKSWISWRTPPPRLDDHPVSHVSWYAAEAFCEWMGGRLPRMKEWQIAAHTAEHRFPWGAGLSARSPLNFCDRACAGPSRSVDPVLGEDGFPETSPVGSFPAGRTREGVFDLSGNVWEWSAEASGSKRATLGGSYLSSFDECSTDRPVWEEAALCAPDGGFRCIWE
ncbi:MAG: SUMF1/EgtB/PvdO family nonheme iron enzyme [Acidobacteriota bacterium]